MHLLAGMVFSAIAIVGMVGPASPAAADSWAPANTGDFPDPAVLYVPSQGTYYAFATQNFAATAQTINIQEATSTDGVTWTKSGSDALPTLGAWAQKGETWAPSVAFDNADSVYVMYYTATDDSSGDQCIGRATSASPQGPYQDPSQSPVLCQTAIGGSIDPDVFTDTSGSSWLLWKNDGNHVGTASYIWSQPLTDQLVLTGSPNPPLLGADQPGWQGNIVEGPEMVSESGTYYLFYSAGNFASTGYAVGWATCASPGGPCRDATTANPVLTTAPGMSGPGGPAVYTRPDGQQIMALAAWQGSTIGYLSCGIRPMYLADLSFSGGIPTLSPAVPAQPAVGPTCPAAPQPPPGYWQVAADGGVFTFGSARFYGSTGSMHLNRPVVGMAATSDGRGYWLVASDGGVFAYGDAGFYGSTGGIVLNQPIVAMIPSLDGRGYWLIARDGGIFAFGDAKFYGSLGAHPPPYPITAAAPGFLDGGYWMVDANGQVFNFGNAPNEGSPAWAPGGYRISGIAPTHDDQGYWLSSWNGNVADLGDAVSHGSMLGAGVNAPVVGIAATHDAGGYWLQGSDGGIFSFGDAPFLGSMGGRPLNAPMVGLAAI